MKKIMLISFCISWFSLLFAQNNISGIYLNEASMEIKIEDNMFYFIVSQSHSPIYANDTLAKCTFEWVDANFIELNSILPDISTYVVQSSDTTINDSIKVSFLIPYQRSKLKIEVHTNIYSTYYLVYSNNNKELMLPNNVESISFFIVPEQIIPHTYDGLFYGIVGYDSFQDYKIEKYNNHISIEIPAIDGSFFEKYYVRGDYAKISGDSITWKREVFRKKQ